MFRGDFMSKKKKKIIIIWAVLILAFLTVFQVAEIWKMFFFQDGQVGSKNITGPGFESDLTSAEKGKIIRNGIEGNKQLTFSCNVDWGEEVIPDILDICREKDIKITFFVSGRWAENNPGLLRDMFLAGHEIQSHGYGHKLCSQVDKTVVKEEILKTEAAILKAINVKTTVFAPPSGDYDDKTVEVAKELGYDIALWSSDTIDWRPGSTANIIIERILKKPLDGAIVLMHPKEETVKALPTLIEEIKGQSIEIVPLYKLKVD